MLTYNLIETEDGTWFGIVQGEHGAWYATDYHSVSDSAEADIEAWAIGHGLDVQYGRTILYPPALKV